MTGGLILDLVITGLLAATVSYGVVLNRRLIHLRRDGAELQTVLGDLDAVVERAEAAISALKTAERPLAVGSSAPMVGETAGGAAPELADDLRFLIERGEAVADRLEDGMKRVRPSEGGSPPPETNLYRGGDLAAALDGIR